MNRPRYRVESSHPIVGPLAPASAATSVLLADRGLAIVLAAKSITRPRGQEIRVIDLLTGHVVYRKTAQPPDCEDTVTRGKDRLELAAG